MGLRKNAKPHERLHDWNIGLADKLAQLTCRTGSDDAPADIKNRPFGFPDRADDLDRWICCRP